MPSPTLPSAFVTRTHALLGALEGEALCQALEGEAVVSLRTNPHKASEVLAAEALGALSLPYEPVPWCESGRYLATRPAFTFDPLLHAGAYYVQEASSMFLEQAARRIMQDISPVRVLDLCAAPGGKSTLWRTLLPASALLVANEPVRLRAAVLAENLSKWGHPATAVTTALPRDFAPLAGFFDVIAADVPCSGEGMFRKDHAARGEWTAESPARCAALQREIIESVWPALRQGGYLVYSTCTFNREENEDNVLHICHTLGAELVPLPTKPEWGVMGDTGGSASLPVYHFFPHHARGEGFFLALLRKTSDCTPQRLRPARPTSAPGAKDAAAWLNEARDYDIVGTGSDEIAALPAPHAEALKVLRANVRTLQMGVPLALCKGRKLIPSAALALSSAVRREAFGQAPLSRDEALRYLRREAFLPQAQVPRGYALASYATLPLGFLNHLGTRANNLYPAEWRIRSTYSH